MSMSLNRAQIIGNITRDPEMRQIPGGQTVTTFGVATNFVWKDQSGERQQKTEYHNVVAWRKLGEICGQYLRKGSKVYIEGRIQTRDWEGEDGVKRYRSEIIADNMIMLDRKSDSGSFGTAPRAQSEKEHMPEEEAPKEKVAATGKKKEKAPAKDLAEKEISEEEITIDDLPF